MSDITIQSSNSTYVHKGANTFEGAATFAGAVSYTGVQTVAWTSGGLSPSTVPNYGVTVVSMTGTDPSTSPRLLYMAAPTAGVAKTIVVGSTAAYINSINVDMGTGVTVNGIAANAFIAFSTLATEYQSLSLLGLSTAAWAVVGCNSTVGSFGVASGIRSVQAATTS